jgi:diguanylate cyclase (GGDEF)-like protein/PAS domain S-box-containing protein
LGLPSSVSRLFLAALSAGMAAGVEPAFALDPRRAISEYHRQSWRTVHGLPQDSVFDTVQTQDGYLWFGTVGGLARFDGVRFTSFLPVNTPGLPNGVIWSLCASRDGGLWIGTEGGLARHDKGTFKTYSTADGLANDPIQALYEDRHGTLWIGTSVPGLVRFKDGRFERLNVEMPELPVKAIADDVEGNLWVGTRAGLTRIKNGQAVTMTTRDGLAEDHVSALFVDRQGALWVGGGSGGKTRVHGGRFTTYPATAGRGGGAFSIRQDGDGQIWFATAGAGLERLYEGRLSVDQREEFSALRSLLLDREGNLWIGTASSGVIRLKDTPFVSYSTDAGLVDKMVRSVAETRDGRIFIANRYSLRVWQNGQFSELARPDADALYPLLVDRSDALWVGTTRHLARFDGKRWKTYLDGISRDLYVHALHEDRDGNMWAGTEHGVFRIRGDKVTRYTVDDGLAMNQVFAIHEDRDRGMWFGTRGGGVSHLQQGRFKSYTTADGLSGMSVRAVYADADGSVWIGTSGDGLTRFRDGKLTAVREKDGLVDGSVFQIVEDGTGHLWLCGVEGISRLDKKELNAFADGAASAVKPLRFGISDGMRVKTCFHGAQPAATRTADDRIWFPTADGLAVVDPNDLGRSNALPPPVQVEAVRVDGRTVPTAGPLELEAGSRELEIEYTALSFIAPEKVRFLYRLEGYDRDWVDPGTRRTAYYMNLRPGGYTFRVKAANDAHVWNEAGAALSFRLRPRFYETWWFLAFAAAAAGFGAWGFHQQRLHRLRVREAELGERVNERTRELTLEITERTRVEEALRESEQRYALAVRGANDGIWDWNLRTGQVYFSPRWKAILGYTEDEVGDGPEQWLDRVHPEDVERVKAGILAHCEGRSTHFEDEHRVRHKDGNYRWVLTRGFAVRDPEGRAYRLVGAQTDVTDRRSHDPLTGLPNRAVFVERLERALTRARHGQDYRVAVLFLDMDRLKVVNDSLGHLAGDRLIASLARELETCVRPGDMIARFGGDEFAVLVEGIGGAEDAIRVAERIQKELQGIFTVQGAEVYTSASIGIAVSVNGAESAEELLRDADTAMYRAKGQGRGRFEVFDAAMRAQVMSLLTLENEFRRAVERREFRLHYQPIVDLETGTLRGFEALVRWQHPRRGLVFPDQFINVAEETGLIIPLGYWVLAEACQQMQAWIRESPRARDLSVAVNISGRQFIDRDLVERVREMLKDSGLDAPQLVLEITESVLMESEGDGSAMLNHLDALGVNIHIDDFGTGYSSLSYLHRFPVDALKIDRSFVGQMPHDGGALVRTILTLAKNLGIPAIAEGVETAQQMVSLRALSCEGAQGRFFSDAVPAREASALLASGRVWAVVGQDG